jgi:hypothetical protein
VEIARHSDVAHAFVTACTDKSEAPVKGNRLRVEDAGLGRDDRSTALPRQHEKVLVQLPPKSSATILRMNTYKVDVSLIRVRLREQTNEKRHQLISVFDHQARVTNMFEQERMHEMAQVARPPGVDRGRDGSRIGRRGRSPD